MRAGLGRTPDDVALLSAATRCTWRDLDRATENLASNLLGLGLCPGDRVASLMPNQAALVIHYVACMKAGLVASPLNCRYTVREIEYALAASGASILIAHAERDQELAGSRGVQALPHGLVFHKGERNRARDLADLIAAAPTPKELPVLEASDPAFIFFTSGSTGPAKGVTHSRDTIGWMFETHAAAFEFTPRDVVMPGSSISHVAGFGTCFGALARGARLVLARNSDSACILEMLREQRPTVLSMQPAVIRRGKLTP